MRPNVVTRTLVSATAIAGITAGSLAGASASLAAPAPATKSAASSQAVAPFAVNNLGLNTSEAQKVQRLLKRDPVCGYTGAIDGQLGTESWKAIQRCLKGKGWGYTGPIDGIVGSGTVKALQRMLKDYGYTGAIDGIVGAGTKAAFKKFANSL